MALVTQGSLPHLDHLFLLPSALPRSLCPQSLSFPCEMGPNRHP